ncbi:hypothetical protein [Cellvibrio japonicus]|uniref:Uncharacterized protein n=1 Tax=Cellvibrio japonicus (strain Ueda107) TaxID=498211 RepID=B3PC52_CELJU|nr:hypothetical protein [Cellvibrio japonicus]ACE84970.1 hypothetical protein CJA_2866 [Cellvibrio japonicus Ueda107]QEI13198.1 hypothetical protein FY117_13835 [Cellvibrio japonicus]QEI16772.1 hypothetical protein FY116_13840 [Cellvibrio japonicus]QEI20350.1 hypothetical protein FY115_13835 [Cellvibrio japonicus]
MVLFQDSAPIFKTDNSLLYKLIDLRPKSVPAIAREFALVVLIKNEKFCNNASGQDEHIEASRSNGFVTLKVITYLNCAHIPDQPELRVWSNTATLSLSTSSPSGMATACLCAHRMVFQISDIHEGVKTIYYVQNGTVLGHVDTPE